jgi:hypothetical protein
MRRKWEAQRGALAAVRRFNATLSAKGYVWFWPKIAAALTSKHHWLIIGRDSCGTVVDLDLRVKPRDTVMSVSLSYQGNVSVNSSINLAEHDVERAEDRRDIGEHVAAGEEIHR